MEDETEIDDDDDLAQESTAPSTKTKMRDSNCKYYFSGCNSASKNKELSWFNTKKHTYENARKTQGTRLRMQSELTGLN